MEAVPRPPDVPKRASPEETEEENRDPFLQVLEKKRGRNRRGHRATANSLSPGRALRTMGEEAIAAIAEVRRKRRERLAAKKLTDLGANFIGTLLVNALQLGPSKKGKSRKKA